jgi:hypothetical protein
MGTSENENDRWPAATPSRKFTCLGLLKTEALDRFTDGELEGKELMAGFLTHVRDARDYRTGLIAQARESPAATPEGGGTLRVCPAAKAST